MSSESVWLQRIGVAIAYAAAAFAAAGVDAAERFAVEFLLAVLAVTLIASPRRAKIGALLFIVAIAAATLLSGNALLLLCSALTAAGVALFCREEEQAWAIPDIFVASAVISAARFIEPTRLADWREWLLVASMTAMVVVLRRHASRAESLSIAIFFTFVIVANDWRTAMTAPLVLLTLVATTQRSKILTAVVAVVALVAGKWMLPFLLLPVAAIVEPHLRRGDTGVAAWIGGASLRALAPLVLMWRELRFLRPHAIAVVASLALLAAVARPYPGSVYALIALAALLLLRDTRDRSDTGALLPWTLLAVTLMPWSGLFSGAFPLPLSHLLLLIAFSVMLTLSFSGKFAPVVHLVAVAAALFLFLTNVTVIEPSGSLDRFVAGGQSLILEVPERPRSLELVASLVGCSGVSGRTAVAEVELLTASGRAYRRTIRSGEVADWAAFRRQDVFSTRNSVPEQSAGAIVGRGRDAFLRGSGAVRFDAPEPIVRLRLRALPAGVAGSGVIVEGMREAAP